MQYWVTAFFNDALGGSFAPGVNENSDLRYMARTAAREYIPMMDGYVPGKAVLVPSKLGKQFFVNGTPGSVAEVMFNYMNRDDRINGNVERSLSVGDVILVESWNNGPVGTIYLAVAPTGFERISPTPEEFEEA